MSFEIIISDDSFDELPDIPHTPDSSLKNRVLKSSSLEESKNLVGVSVISCPMGGCKVETNNEETMMEHMQFYHVEDDEKEGISGSEEDGPLRGLSFNVEESKQEKALKGKNKGVGISVIRCPMGSCPVEKNNAVSMTEHIELYHFGEENEREETMDGSDKKGPLYDSNFNVEIESKKEQGISIFGKKDKKRHGGRESNVPKADDMVLYKGYKTKYCLVQLNGMIETAEKNLFDIEQGKTKVKWSKTMYYEWLNNEISDSKTWTKETLRRRTTQIDECCEKLIMSKKEGKKTGMGDYDKEMDAQLRPDRQETYVHPKTEEEKSIASLKNKFNQLRKAIGEAKFAKPEAYIEPKLAAKANAVNKLFQADEEKCDQTPKINRRLPSTLQGKDENLYEKSRNKRDGSVRGEPRNSKRKVHEEEDVETQISNLVELAKDQLKKPQQANVHPGFPVLAYPYPGMLGPPGGYYHNMMPGFYPMGVGMAMNPAVENPTASGGSPVPIGKSGGPVMPPSGAGWPIPAGQMYSPIPRWPMGMSTANWNMASSSATSRVPPMPHGSGPAWYGLPGYTSNPAGPSTMSSTSSTEVPPVSTPGVIVSTSSAPDHL